MAATVYAAFPLVFSSTASRAHPRIKASTDSAHQNSLPVHKLEKPQRTGPLQASDERFRCLDRRQLLGISAAVPLLGLVFSDTAFGLLEADDDEALLEKAKVDRQKRLQKREVLNSFKKETASVQNAVYNLSRVGEALDVSDYSTASTILGESSGGAEWVVEVKNALSKVSMNVDEKAEADQFSSSLSSLQKAEDVMFAISKRDPSSSKSAFVASASALSKWSALTGLFEQIKGL